MHRLKDYENYRLNVPELKLILAQMGFFSNFKRKKIVFNPKPFSKPKNKTESHVDFHIDVTKKIDEIIEKNKEDEQINNDKNLEIPRIVEPRFVEIREPFIRAPEIPTFQTGLGPKEDVGDLDNIQEFIEIEPPTNFLMENQQENKDEFSNWMIDNQTEKEQKTFQALGPIKLRVRGKETEKTPPNKNNKTTIARIELEETKKEIERKKKELEEALKKEKEKELEVKKEEEEKRQLEKLRKIELKKKQKEDKIKEKLAAKKAIIEKELELKQLEELKRLELLKKIKLEEKIAKEEKLPPDFTDVLEKKKEPGQEHLILDEDVAKLIPIIDSLFEKLPEEVVDEFTKSEYFELYEKVLLKYKNK